MLADARPSSRGDPVAVDARARLGSHPVPRPEPVLPPSSAFDIVDARLRKRMDERIRAGNSQGPLIALDFVHEMRQEDAETFHQALDELALFTIRALMSDISRDRNTRTGRQKRGAKYRAARDAHHAGDDGPLHSYLEEHVTTDARGTRKMLGDCRSPDLLFIAGRSRANERTHRFRAALTEAMARECQAKDCSVRERYDDRQLAALDRSLRPGQPSA